MPSNIDSRLLSFGELLRGGRRFSVPIYQRDYSWTDNEVDQLWKDVTETVDEERPEHFMGAIVVNNASDVGYQLIDGQQRLATISVLMCAIRDAFLSHGDQERAGVIAREYLGEQDLATLDLRPKLTLNENNNEFYSAHIAQAPTSIANRLQQLSALERRRDVRRSNKLLVRAYLMLQRLLSQRMEASEAYLDELVSIQDRIKDKLIAILITVADETNAYMIFETLNDRGLELSVADLLKNHVFSRAATRLDEVKRRWHDVNTNLGEYELTKFIRHDWISRNPVIRERELYRTISARVRTTSDVVGFLREMEGASRIYGAFADMSSPVWDGYPTSVQRYLRNLRLFKVTQCYPVILAAKDSLIPSVFEDVLRMLVVLTFRYNVICDFATNTLEAVYSETARYIRSAPNARIATIFGQYLSRIYPNDETFKESFSTRSVTAAPLARYILAEIANHQQPSRLWAADPDGPSVTLEHILPKRPTALWLKAFESVADTDEYVDRIGNLTLLPRSANSDVGNRSFQEKCQLLYGQSDLPMTRSIARFAQWGPDEIEERQTELALLASQTWRLDY